MKATGTFEIKLSPLESYSEGGDGGTFARMSIDKTFVGDLTGVSTGEMLSSRSPVAESAGYVAIEHFTGTLSGKKGAFVLQHFGTMSANHQHLNLVVVPDSGTDELHSLSGQMQIIIDNGQHSYVFDYSLAEHL